MQTRSIALLIPLVLAARVVAVDVEGVLPASLDQPRVYLAISRDAKGPPLAAKARAGDIADLLGGAIDGKKPGKDEVVEQFAVQAFLDTGASGVMLAKSTAEGLGLVPITSATGAPVTFHDIGVAGEEAFPVGPALYFRIAEFSSRTEGDDLGQYAPAVGPIRPSLRGSVGMIEQMMGGIDVAGMPVMAGKVVVADARRIAKQETLSTRLVAPGDKSIPPVDLVVPLTYVDFARFTRTEPPAAPKVSLLANPMIGPSPFVKGDTTKPIALTHRGKSASVTMLLDTGAGSSMLSVAKARELGIAVDEAGNLTNVPADQQFTLPIGGIGGTKTVHGFYVDVLQVPTARGGPLRYLKAPVLILDIKMTDHQTGEAYTLDGVFGMNYLVASANVTGGISADFGDIHDGPFDFIVIDHAKRTLGLAMSRAVAGDAAAEERSKKPDASNNARRPTRGPR